MANNIDEGLRLMEEPKTSGKFPEEIFVVRYLTRGDKHLNYWVCLTAEQVSEFSRGNYIKDVTICKPIKQVIVQTVVVMNDVVEKV